jgi:hypothetical protein
MGAGMGKTDAVASHEKSRDSRKVYRFANLCRGLVLKSAEIFTSLIRSSDGVGERLEGEVALPHLPSRKVLQYGLSRNEWERRRPT